MERIEPLQLHIGLSETIARYVAAIHILPLTVCLMLPVEIYFKSIAACLIVTSGIYHWFTRARQQGRDVITCLEKGEDEYWLLYHADGRVLTARLLTSSFISHWLMILHFAPGQFQRRYVLLAPDSAESEKLRRLRVEILNSTGEADKT